MKKLIVTSFVVLSLMTSVGVSASSHVISTKFQTQSKTETFKVYGNCGMCEKTIEGSLKNVKGIDKADWNKETKMMEVTFDPEVISLTEIKQKIADVGYDSDEVRASEKAYNKLPGCCQYDRPENNEDHHNHQH